jgi:hypothetical protein
VTRIYRHTIADAPGAARPLLEGFGPFSPTGEPLDLPAEPVPAAAGVAGSGAAADGRG